MRGIWARWEDVRRADCFRERDAIGMVTQNDDLIGARRLAAITPHKPTAPSPTTATFFPRSTSRHPRCVIPAVISLEGSRKTVSSQGRLRLFLDSKRAYWRES